VNATHKPKIYYASSLFNEGERTFNLRVKAVLDGLGFETWFPQEDAGFLERYMEQGMSLEEARQAIFRMNLAAVEESDVLLFNLDGRVPDEGACIEAGIAYGRGKRCIGLQTDFRAVEPGGNNLMIDGVVRYEIAGNLDDLKSMLKDFVANREAQQDSMLTVDLRTRPDHYVTLSGPLGVGKSTLLQVMADQGWNVSAEAIAENPYLDRVYANLADFGFRMQAFYLGSRAKQHRLSATISGSLVQERSLEEDGEVFLPAYRDAGAYESSDYDTLKTLYEALASTTPQPGLAVYLTAPFEMTLERITKRGRGAEKDLDENFARAVYERYAQWAATTTTPILTVDTAELDLATSASDATEVMGRIARALRSEQVLT
jgi:deoxyadenosine/deoxycytidine kinase